MPIVLLTVALLQAPAAPAPQQAGSLTRFLQQSIGLDRAQFAAFERGEPVAKVLDATDRRDVVVFGIVTSATTRPAFARHARDFAQSLRAPTRTQLGLFGNPAGAGDVAAFTLNPRDVAEMKNCRPGDCVVKLPATDMQRIHDQMNWSASPVDLQTQLSVFARRRMVEYVNDYRTRGDAALAVYDDRGNMNVRSSEAFAAQVAESPYMYQNVPSLTAYLAAYPRGPLPPGAAEVIYWSEDALPRLRPILSITQLVVYDPQELPDATIVAAKQIYANHYFETALDVTCAIERPGGTGSYVLVLRRYRFDNLPGGILNIRGKAIGALRDQLLADLRRY